MNFKFIVVFLTLVIISKFAAAGSVLPYAYDIDTASSEDCKKTATEISNNNRALNKAIAKNETCLAGKILVTNQKLMEVSPNCQYVLNKNYYTDGKCKDVKFHMKLSMQKLNQLVQSGRECEAGEIIKQDQDFLKQYPECKVAK